MGQDGQEYFGVHWLKCEICKPCSASCVLFLAPTGCSCMCAGRHKAEWEGMMGRNGQELVPPSACDSWKVRSLAGSLANYII